MSVLEEILWESAIATLGNEIDGGFLVLDHQKRIKYISSTLSNQIPDQNDILEKELLEVFPSFTWPVYSQMTGMRCEVEVRECPLTGRPGPIRIRIVPMKGEDGVPLGSVVILGEQRKESVVQSLCEITATAAHEIRNPLAGMKGFLQLLKDRLSEEDGRYVAMVLHEVDRVNELTRYLLALTRSTIKDLEVGCPYGLIQEVFDACRPRAMAQGVEIKLGFPEKECLVEYDKDRFQQIFSNLAHNALDAMSCGGELTVNCSLNEEAGLLVISVSDTGPGIAPEHLGHIFEPFYTTKPSGTGLGLALCRSFVQQHGGSISVESLPGNGSNFHIEIPLFAS